MKVMRLFVVTYEPTTNHSREDIPVVAKTIEEAIQKAWSSRSVDRIWKVEDRGEVVS